MDDPTYIAGLPKGHPLKANENVFAFSASCASMQLLQMLALALAPLDQPNPGTHSIISLAGSWKNRNLRYGAGDDLHHTGNLAHAMRNAYSRR